MYCCLIRMPWCRVEENIRVKASYSEGRCRINERKVLFDGGCKFSLVVSFGGYGEKCSGGKLYRILEECGDDRVCVFLVATYC